MSYHYGRVYVRLSPFPNGKRFAVCVTIDFDGLSIWIGSLGLKDPSYLSRGEYGARVGVPRLLSLFRELDVKTTWFVPGHTVETFPELVERVYRDGHEIGHHGYLHENLSKLDEREERRVIEKGIEAIERLTRSRPLGFRAPSWEISHRTIDLLIEYGFSYDSSLMADDYTPYYLRVGDYVDEEGRFHRGRASRLMEIPVSWSLDDWPHFEFLELPNLIYPGLRSYTSVLENFVADFEYMREELEWGVFTLTLHPEVIGRGHRMTLLKKFLTYVKGHDDVFFARMIDVVENLRRSSFLDEERA